MIFYLLLLIPLAILLLPLFIRVEGEINNTRGGAGVYLFLFCLWVPLLRVEWTGLFFTGRLLFFPLQGNFKQLLKPMPPGAPPLQKLAGTLRVAALIAKLRVGTAQADKTACLVGLLEAAAGALCARHMVRLRIYPNFENTGVSLRADCIITVVLAHSIGVLSQTGKKAAKNKKKNKQQAGQTAA